ncbi:MAG: hypothetical protein JWN11_1544 [Hyphomicrobiales bacterium]|nr:hypothetical protein [Hyphomicrobiales bacterium]
MLTRRNLLIAGSSMLLLPLPALASQDLAMKSLYDDADLSQQAKAFNGTEVSLKGFMAPPLKPNAKFFVLGTEPMMICPFCDSAAQWPQNIVLVYTRDPIHMLNYDQGIVVTGKLDIGVKTDQDTGFVSKVRLIDSEYHGRPTVSIGF